MDDETRTEIRRLARAVNKNVRETKSHREVIEKLNGGVDALISLKAMLPQLLKVANHAEKIVELAEAKSDDDAFWRGFRRRVNPIRPFGAILWSIIVAMLGAIAYEFVKYKISGHF